MHVIHLWFWKILWILTRELNHCLGLEHRYCWLPKTLEMFQAEEKDSPRPKKILCGVYWCMQSRTWRSSYARQPHSGTWVRVPYLAIGQVKVQWKHHSPNEATWELEASMWLAHPFLFNFAEHWGQCQCSILLKMVKNRGQCCCKGEWNVIPQFWPHVI